MLSLRLKGRYTPQSTLSEDRVISSLLSVVIDTQRQIYPPVNTIRGQSDLFTVQCCHWHSKADIPPIQHYQSTEWSLHCSMLSLTLKGRYTPLVNIAVDRVISPLFIVGIDNQRQIYPPFNTNRGQSDLFTVQCCHWDSKADIPPIQHCQRTEWSLHCSMLSLTLKGRYTPHSTLSEDRVIFSLFNVVIDTQRLIYPPGQHYQRTEWSLHCSLLSLTLKGRYTPLVNIAVDRMISSLFIVGIDTQRQIYPPFNTVRGQSDLFTVQCCHWHSKADIPPSQHYQRTEWSFHCWVLSLTLKGRYTPHSTLSEDRVISSLFNVVIDTQRQIYPHSQQYQRKEWSLHCSLLALTIKGRYTPHSTLSEDRVISSLFNVVIDTQREIYPQFNTVRGQSDLFTVECCHWHSKADIHPIQHYQRTEWSLHCSMLSLILKGRYTPTVNTIRGQSDLFTVQCCHWHSKADITPWSTLSEHRLISSLFSVFIDQRQIYPPIQHYQSIDWSLHCSMLSLTLKGRYTPWST